MDDVQDKSYVEGSEEYDVLQYGVASSNLKRINVSKEPAPSIFREYST
jgi:hypothetical protein